MGERATLSTAYSEKCNESSKSFASNCKLIMGILLSTSHLPLTTTIEVELKIWSFCIVLEILSRTLNCCSYTLCVPPGPMLLYAEINYFINTIAICVLEKPPNIKTTWKPKILHLLEQFLFLSLYITHHLPVSIQDLHRKGKLLHNLTIPALVEM